MILRNTRNLPQRRGSPLFARCLDLTLNQLPNNLGHAYTVTTCLFGEKLGLRFRQRNLKTMHCRGHGLALCNITKLHHSSTPVNLLLPPTPPSGSTAPTPAVRAPAARRLAPWPSTPRNVELDREMWSEQGEVPVRGQNCHTVPVGDRANHEVGVRALDSPRAAYVEELSRALMISRLDRQVRELSEVGSEPVELRLLSNPQKHLLANGADEMSSTLADELAELQHRRVLRDLPPAQSQGPDAGVDQDVHSRLRCSL